MATAKIIKSDVLFCWTYIPMIISFIEGIIAITKPSDENGRIEI